MGRLISVMHPGLRVVIAGLWLVGAAVAGFTCVRSMARIGIGAGMAFAVVALALSVLALGALRGARWALRVSVVLAGAQVLGVIGAAGELIWGGETAKTRELRTLGIDPTFGIVLNLTYACLAASLFLWILTRALIAQWSTSAS